MVAGCKAGVNYRVKNYKEFNELLFRSLFYSASLPALFSLPCKKNRCLRRKEEAEPERLGRSRLGGEVASYKCELVT
jgi:hypothetical protein